MYNLKPIHSWKLSQHVTSDTSKKVGRGRKPWGYQNKQVIVISSHFCLSLHEHPMLYFYSDEYDHHVNECAQDYAHYDWVWQHFVRLAVEIE